MDLGTLLQERYSLLLREDLLNARRDVIDKPECYEVYCSSELFDILEQTSKPTTFDRMPNGITCLVPRDLVDNTIAAIDRYIFEHPAKHPLRLRFVDLVRFEIEYWFRKFRRWCHALRCELSAITTIEYCPDTREMIVVRYPRCWW
jgi:hypothetical protein